MPPSAVGNRDFGNPLLDAGVTITRGPIDLPAWRHRALFFHDPDGTLIEIYAEY